MPRPAPIQAALQDVALRAPQTAMSKVSTKIDNRSRTDNAAVRVARMRYCGALVSAVLVFAAMLIAPEPTPATSLDTRISTSLRNRCHRAATVT
jgi:hypothetical protein